MARYKSCDYRQRILLPVSLEDQLMPGTLEFAIHTLVEKRLDLSIFEGKYRNDETGRPRRSMPLWKDPKTGKYRCQFQYLGKRYSKTGFATQKAAGKWIVDRRTELEQEAQTPPSPPTPSVSASGPLDLESLKSAPN
jgi:hypothetical protein